MRWPWRRREEAERLHHEAAEEALDRVRRQWPEVHAAGTRLRRERHLNGWTDTIVGIFESPHHGRDSQ